MTQGLVCVSVSCPCTVAAVFEPPVPVNPDFDRRLHTYCLENHHEMRVQCEEVSEERWLELARRYQLAGAGE